MDPSTNFKVRSVTALCTDCHPSRVFLREGSAVREETIHSRSPSSHQHFTFGDRLRGGLWDDSFNSYWLLGVLLSLIGVLALCYFYSRNEILLSGDAVAHINIARRVFDSRTPGLLQLGSVWLPLPHLLTIPFILSGRMWQSGIGGSIVSVFSYVLGGMGLFRLLSAWSRLAAWIGVAVFAANPNLLYVQTTALNEPLYLASFIWTMLYFLEAGQRLRQGDRQAGVSLEKGAIALTAAILTRYDGWFFAVVCWFSLSLYGAKAIAQMPKADLAPLRRAVFKALLLTALGPALWLAYNFGVYGSALDFANGPYSARAIAQRTTAQGAPPYPGENHPITAGVYFTKAAQLNLGEGSVARVLVLLAVLASVAFAVRREWLPVVLLWSPLSFYSLSIAYGSVPIFLPVWWPFSYYNVRYGLELLPAIAAGLGLSVVLIQEFLGSRRLRLLVPIVVLCIVCYLQAWRAVPICLREVRVNGQARAELDRQIAMALKPIPRQATLLAYTGAHSGAYEVAGFPLRQTINEGNFFIWDASLKHPATAADYVIASDGDPVADSVAQHPSGLSPIAKIEVAGQPRTVIYESHSR